MSKLSRACENMKNEMNEMKEYCKKKIVEEDLFDDPDTMITLAHSFKMMETCEEMMTAYAEEMERMSRGIELILTKLENIETR